MESPVDQAPAHAEIRGGRSGDPRRSASPTIWFDTSDIHDWSRPQLTGIQRVVATVLGELLREGHAIRLFRLDQRSKRLVELQQEALPPVIRKYGGIPSRTKDRRRNRERRRAPPAGLAGRVRGLAERAGAAGRAIRGRLFPGIGAIRFHDGDIVLSLSLTWGFAGYWSAIGRAKRQGACFIQLIHDAAPILYPEWLPASWEGMATDWFAGVAGHADRILTISRFQKAEVESWLAQRHVRVPVTVVKLGDDPPRFAKGRPGRKATRKPRRPFILYVSGFYPRKNHAALHAAWRKLAVEFGEACPLLVLVGARVRARFGFLAPLRRDRMVRILFDATDEQLAELYRTCLFTVYPSHYEGWGLPVAESLRCGRYCIASSASSLPEVGGDLVDYVEPSDHEELYRKLSRAIREPDYVREREAVIRADYRPWSWKDSARQIFDAVADFRASAG